MAPPRVVVVGGGIAGTAVAVELATRNARVTLVERDQPGVGATGASAGMLAPQYEGDVDAPDFPFAVACREAWPSFRERLEALADWDMGFRTDGMLVANRSRQEEEHAGKALEAQKALGLPGEILTPGDARARHGDIAPGVPSWLWLPAEAHLDAQRLAVALADAVQAAGVELVRNAQVRALTARGGRATGVRLVDGLPRPLPVRPIRGQMLRLLPPEPLPWTLVCDHDGRYLVPRVNGSILVGSTMEDVGFQEAVTEEGRELLARAAAELIPKLEEGRIVESWAGLRPISADNLPILGPDPELEGMFYATGHGRNGVLFAPLVGRAVAELVLRDTTAVAWEAFRIQRFQETES
jgi:glycine oxidase